MRRFHRLGDAIEARDELQVLAHREILIEAEALRHVADVTLDLARLRADVVAEAGPLALVGREQAGEHADGRRLAGAVRTQEAIDRAALDLHRQVAHDLAPVERLGQTVHIDGDVGGHFGAPFASALVSVLVSGLVSVLVSVLASPLGPSVTRTGWPTRRRSG